MTSLNIGTVAPDRRPAGAPKPGPCPQCQAKPQARIDGGSFGGYAVTLCGNCGYEFKESEL